MKKRRQIKFIGMQLLALVSNRYTPDLMSRAVTLYLRSRNAYTALRKLLVLLCHNTIYDYFGKHGLTGGLIECERTLRNVFRVLMRDRSAALSLLTKCTLSQVRNTKENT